MFLTQVLHLIAFEIIQEYFNYYLVQLQSFRDRSCSKILRGLVVVVEAVLCHCNIDQCGGTLKVQSRTNYYPSDS